MITLPIGWRHPGGSNYLLPLTDNFTGREVVSMKTCSIDGCKGKHEALGYCSMHYKRFKRHGDHLFVKLNMTHDEVCKIDGCNEKYHGLGFCQKHYTKFKNYGDPLHVEPNRHRMSYSPEYKIWVGMKQRCFNKKHIGYHRYGGRGITVCDRWKDSFINFYSDMGKRPTANHQIDRIDNDGNYEPGNCRWVTQLENTRKQPRIKLSMEKAKDIREKYKTGKYGIKELSVMYNVKIRAIYSILNNKTWIEV